MQFRCLIQALYILVGAGSPSPSLCYCRVVYDNAKREAKSNSISRTIGTSSYNIRILVFGSIWQRCRSLNFEGSMISFWSFIYLVLDWLVVVSLLSLLVASQINVYLCCWVGDWGLCKCYFVILLVNKLQWRMQKFKWEGLNFIFSVTLLISLTQKKNFSYTY